MNLTTAQSVLALILAVAAVVGLVLSVRRWASPRWRNVKGDGVAMRDAVIGRPAVVDTITGKELAPALPGIGVRMAHQEQQMELLAVTVTKLVDQQTHQRALEQRVNLHDDRIRALEEAAVERVVGKAESAQAWSAMEAAIKATPSADDAPPAVE
jgi:hypothetical protein